MVSAWADVGVTMLPRGLLHESTNQSRINQSTGINKKFLQKMVVEKQLDVYGTIEDDGSKERQLLAGKIDS